MTYILRDQVKYCNGDYMHPFLEETYLNLGILKRSMRQFGEAETQFRKAEELQKSMYGHDHPALVCTLKQVGVCQLGLQMPQLAQKSLNEAKDLLVSLMSDEDDAETKQKDKEELSALYGQLYLAYLIVKQLPEAADCVQESIKFLAERNGDRSSRLCSKYYQLATTYQLDNKFGEALQAIAVAIDIHKSPVEQDPSGFARIQEKMSPEQRTNLDYNIVMYTAFESSTNFIEGNYQAAIKSADEGIKLCNGFMEKTAE